MDQSDQSEINLINDSLLTNAAEQWTEGRARLMRGKMDVNTLYQVTGQRGEQIAGNDEKYQMKTTSHSAFFPRIQD